MKKFRIIALIMCLAIAVTVLASCSSKNQDGYCADNEYVPENQKQEEIFGDGIGTRGESGKIPENKDRKIIKTVQILAETKEFDKTVSSMASYISKYEGYIQSSDVNGKSMNYGGNYERRATYTIRIPADKLEDFLSDLGTNLNITSNISSISDVSPQYYDIESRIKTLQTEKEALTKMYEKADTVEYMLKVQSRLYDVIEEIEAYQTKLNYYDSQVNYSTVTLSIMEVVTYTDVTESVSYGERLLSAFKNSWKNFVTGLKNFSVNFVYAFPTLLIIGVIAAVVIIITVKIVKKKKAKKAERRQQ